MGYGNRVVNRNRGVPKQMLPEQGFSSRELVAWIEEEVRESLRVKQALLQECAETLAAICAALALTANSSTLTAVANDYGYDEVFARQVAAFGTKNDAAIGISTSGNSPNVLRGISAARERGMLTIGFTGSVDGPLRGAVNLCLAVPSAATSRIQECHILAGHIVSGYCERVLTEQAVQAARKG